MFKQESRKEVFDAVIANKGGTFNLGGEPVSPSSGFAVGVVGFETVTPVEGMSALNFENLANDLLRKVDGLADPATHFIGAWINDGNLYLDLSVLMKDKSEAIAKAVAGSQLAIWDFANEEEIPTS